MLEIQLCIFECKTLIKVRLWNFYLLEHDLIILSRGLLKQNRSPIYNLDFYQKKFAKIK